MSSRFSVPASKAARDQSSPAIWLALKTVVQRGTWGCHLCEHCGLSAKVDTKLHEKKIHPFSKRMLDHYFLDYDLFISRKRRKKVNNVTSELDHYFEEDVVTRTPNFDVLTWWKSNASKYPTLQAIARDFLAILVSTIASESAFSTSGRLVSPYRSRLHPDTLEALMCAQSLLWAIEMQGNSTLESVGYATIYDDMDVNQS